MALMNFGKEYSVGVQTIDDQHKVLFGIINDLHEGMMMGQARSLTGPLLNKLADYTRNHFTAEEAMMTAAAYPKLAAHKILHRNLVKQVEDYIARYDRGETTLNIQLLNFLRDWLTNHIQKEDKQYSPCMIEHGLH
jgi:hemerythrin